MFRTDFVIACVLISLLLVGVVMTALAPSPKTILYRILSEKTNIRIIDPCKKLAVPRNDSTKQPTLCVRSDRFYRRIISSGELGFSEGYIEGDWTTNNLEALLYQLMEHRKAIEDALYAHSATLVYARCVSYVKSLTPTNTLASAPANIGHHYDIGNDLYIEMLGPTMQYTCAYYNRPGMTLDEAQEAKMRLVAKKLNLRPGMRVLDIGCGFGGMGYLLASQYGVRVVGVTLSKRQVMYAKKHYVHPDLNVMYQDYRDVARGTGFDRIYSIGMFEHVGKRQYGEYFAKCDRLLKPQGLMLLHTIGTHDRHARVQDNTTFVGKYIFPEGEIPHASSLTSETDTWYLEDWQNFGLSYAKTLRAWHRNLGTWKALNGSQYDERFRRMWTLYLLGFAATFQHRELSLWQVVYTKRGNRRRDDTHHIRSC